MIPIFGAETLRKRFVGTWNLPYICSSTPNNTIFKQE